MCYSLFINKSPPMSTYYSRAYHRDQVRSAPKPPPIRYVPAPKETKGDPEVHKMLVKAGLSDFETMYFTTPHSKLLLKNLTDSYHVSLITKKELIDIIYILLSIWPALGYDFRYMDEYAPLHRRIYRCQERIEMAFKSFNKDKPPSQVVIGLFASLRYSHNLSHSKVKPTYLVGWILDIIRYTEIMSENQQIPGLKTDLAVKEYLTPNWNTQYFKMKAFSDNWPQLVKKKANSQKEEQK